MSGTANFFVTIIILIFWVHLSKASDWCERAADLIDNNDLGQLTELMRGERSNSIDCIEALLDSFIIHNVSRSAVAETYKSRVIMLTDIYSELFSDPYFQKKSKRIFSYSVESMVEKKRIIQLKRSAVGKFYHSDLRSAQEDLFSGLKLASKINDPDDQANLTGIIGATYFYLGDFDSALIYYEKSLNVYQSLGNLSRIADGLNNMANVYSDRSEYETALKYFTEAKIIHQKINDRRGLAADQNNLGLVNEEKGNYDQALHHYQMALNLNRAIDNQRSVMKNMANIANIHIEKSEYDQAKAIFDELLPLRKQSNDIKGEGNDYGNLGIIYDARGDYQTAIAYFQKAYQIHHDIEYREGEAYQCGRLGGMYLKYGQFAQAARMYQQAYAIHIEMDHKRGAAYWCEALGVVYANVADYDRAMDELEKALNIHREIGNQSGMASCLSKIGHVFIDLKNYPAAQNCFSTALLRHRELGEKRNECLSLSDMAYLAYVQKNYDQGIVWMAQARDLAALIDDPALLAWIHLLNGDLYSENDDPVLAIQNYEKSLALTEGLHIPEIRWQIYYGIGKLRQRQSDKDRAYYNYRAAINSIEEIRHHAVVDELKSGVIHDRFTVYESMITLLAELGRAEESLAYVERSRARGMLDMLGNIKIKTQKPGSVGTAAREQALRNIISEYQSRAISDLTSGSQAGRENNDSKNRDNVISMQKEYTRLLVDLKINDPRYYDQITTEPVSLGQIQQTLGTNTAFLEYFISSKRIIVYVITGNDIHLVQIPAGMADVKGKILLFRGTAVQKINPDKLQNLNWVKPLHGLYKILFAPVEASGYLKNITNLIISPQGILHYLPFQTLITHYDVTDQQTIRPSYLIEKYDISYMPSASMLKFFRFNYKKPESKILLMAPDIDNLPDTREEVATIARNFPGSSDLFINNKATESRIKSDSYQYDIIHLATRAHFNPYNPLFSSIDLHACDIDDGRLEVNEIYNLDLNARLTVLSACQTALGAGHAAKFPNGEDLISLSSAFLYAGSSSVISSLWEIADPVTAEFMSHFYNNLSGLPLAAALAKTQREFITSTDEKSNPYNHPYYWAPFILTGQWQ